MSVIYALLTCAMVPGPVLAGVSGLLFGALGTVIAIVSATLGASAAFLIAGGLAQNEQFPIAREQRRTSPHSLAHWAAARLRGQRGVSAVQRLELRFDRAGRIVEAKREAPKRKPTR